jgi:hypothetical protein
MPRRDEDALSWDGDDDPTLDTGAPAAADDPTDAHPADPAPLPDGWTAVGRGSEGVGHPTTPPPPPIPADAPAVGATDTAAPSASVPPGATPATAPATLEAAEDAGLGTAALVSIGVLGGVYLLFAIGWLVGGLRLQGRYQVLVTDSMYQGALWLATAAPLIWFATTLFATRKSRAWVRWLWLAFGVLLLIPWPFLMIGAVGR